ncbi:MAG: SDR family oxidoreductase [Bacillota bacterium]|nr:SDR family oxidoreductase [Bacillota bacterium]
MIEVEMAFHNKTAVITGVSQGIGLALARAFQDQGAKVAGIDQNPCPIELDLFTQGDIAEPAVLEDFAEQIKSAFSGVDCLINNAMRSFGGLPDCGYEDFVRAQKIGVAAPYYLTKLLLPVFSPGASVINLSSSRAFQSQKGTESYSAAKGGITALTHAMAVSLSGRVRVNAIAPGWINTTESVFEGADKAQHPAGRVGAPEDIVNAALFLASEKASFITGQTLLVDGGMSRLMVYHNDEGWTYSPD